MEEAIAAVTGGLMSVREAARKHGVARTTLQRKLSRAAGASTSSSSQAASPSPASDPAPLLNSASGSFLAVAGDADERGAAAQLGAMASGEMLKQERSSDGATSTSYSSGTSSLSDADYAQEQSAAGRKRSAEQMERSSLSKGPRRAINCKIRMLCASAGSALDELSNEMILEGKAIYKLGLGQSPFPIPQCIVDELRANSHQRDYLPVAGLPALRADIAAWGTKSLHLDYSKDDVLIGPGTKELLFVLQTVYYGDLLLPNPSCTSYAPQANIAGRNMMWLPTFAEDHWVLRPEVLEELCEKDPGKDIEHVVGLDAPRILILNSPSNPTGCAYHDEELRAVAEVARKYRVLVISDEIYSELHHTGDHLSISRHYPEGTIVSGGLSKWCGAGGWRMGFWLFPPSMRWLRKSMLVMASETYTSVASPIQYAARRAFVPDCIEISSYKAKCRCILQLIGRWCVYQLQKMDVEVQLPEGGFYIFPSFARHRKALAGRGIATDALLCSRLLQDTGVAILPGSCFGRRPEELFVRLAFVDFKGEIALYLIESMQDDLALDAVEGFIKSVCPNLDVAMRKLANWIAPPITSLAP